MRVCDIATMVQEMQSISSHLSLRDFVSLFCWHKTPNSASLLSMYTAKQTKTPMLDRKVQVWLESSAPDMYDSELKAACTKVRANWSRVASAFALEDVVGAAQGLPQHSTTPLRSYLTNSDVPYELESFLRVLDCVEGGMGLSHSQMCKIFRMVDTGAHFFSHSWL